MVILGGHWEFFDEEHFKGAKMGELGPGVYLNLISCKFSEIM